MGWRADGADVAEIGNGYEHTIVFWLFFHQKFKNIAPDWLAPLILLKLLKPLTYTTYTYTMYEHTIYLRSFILLVLDGIGQMGHTP